MLFFATPFVTWGGPGDPPTLQELPVNHSNHAQYEDEEEQHATEANRGNGSGSSGSGSGSVGGGGGGGGDQGGNMFNMALRTQSYTTAVEKPSTTSSGPDNLLEQLCVSSGDGDGIEGAAGPSNSGAVEPVELSPLQALQTLRFWSLWLIFGVTVGGDIMVLNILSSMSVFAQRVFVCSSIGVYESGFAYMHLFICDTYAIAPFPSRALPLTQRHTCTRTQGTRVRMFACSTVHPYLCI